MNTKKEQRKSCLAKRKKRTIIAKKMGDFIIFKRICKIIREKNIKEIGIYWSKKYEVDTEQIIDYCLKNNIKVFLPKIINKQEMIFLEYKDKSDLILNTTSNVYEPKQTKNPKTDLKFIIVPMVGYDHQLNRIGYGGGYYDRFLENKNIYKIGIAYKVQKVDKVITDKYDVPMDLIISNYFIF